MRRRNRGRHGKRLLPGPFTAVFLLLASLCFPFALSGAAGSSNAEVVWLPVPEEDVAGYRVHYGPSSRYEPDFDSYPYVRDLRAGEYTLAGGEASCTLSGLDREVTYWVSVTAYDVRGNESGFSNEKMITLSDGDYPGACQLSATSSGVGRTESSMAGWAFFFLSVLAWLLRQRGHHLTD